MYVYLIILYHIYIHIFVYSTLIEELLCHDCHSFGNKRFVTVAVWFPKTTIQIIIDVMVTSLAQNQYTFLERPGQGWYLSWLFLKFHADVYCTLTFFKVIWHTISVLLLLKKWQCGTPPPSFPTATARTKMPWNAWKWTRNALVKLLLGWFGEGL